MSKESSPPSYDQALAMTIETLETTMWVTGYETDPDLVVELSKTDQRYFEILRLSVGKMVIEEEPIPKPYRNWLYAFLYGGIQPPKRPAGRLADPHKTEMVVDLVDRLVTLGMNPTKNDTAEHSNTACDVVADALTTLGQQPNSYLRVKKIWLENRRKP